MGVHHCPIGRSRHHRKIAHPISALPFRSGGPPIDCQRPLSSPHMTEIDALLQENRKFPPSAEFRRQAHLSDTALYRSAADNAESFWEARAAELEWFSRWKKVLDWKP